MYPSKFRGLVAPTPIAHGGHPRFAPAYRVMRLSRGPPTRLELEHQGRQQRINHSQSQYKELFNSLQDIIEQLKWRYLMAQQHANYETASDGADECSSSSASSTSGHSSMYDPRGPKRKLSDDDEDYVLDLSCTPKYQALRAEYPKVWPSDPPSVIIGPNGTIVDAREFYEISWDNVAGATRHLLTLIFSNETLATHTLSGKPSPAFFGRERPAKLQLDPIKVEDVLFCVRLMTCAKDRDIRAAITTKCADMAKKLKRATLKLTYTTV